MNNQIERQAGSTDKTVGSAIHIEVEQSVTPEMRESKEFQMWVDAINVLAMNPKEVRRATTHEAIHAVEHSRLFGTKLRFRGPRIFFDNGLVASMCGCVVPAYPLSAHVVHVARACLAPKFLMPVIFSEEHESDGSFDNDLENCKKWARNRLTDLLERYDNDKPVTAIERMEISILRPVLNCGNADEILDACTEPVIGLAREAVLADFQNDGAYRNEIAEEAEKFRAAIFPHQE